MFPCGKACGQLLRPLLEKCSKFLGSVQLRPFEHAIEQPARGLTDRWRRADAEDFHDLAAVEREIFRGERGFREWVDARHELGSIERGEISRELDADAREPAADRDIVSFSDS